MTKETLIDGLNEDLAAELGTIVRYNYQASKCFGPGGIELREMFEDEIKDETGHARFLSDVIVDLGGEPTVSPKPFDKPTDIRAAIELDVRLEQQDAVTYMKHADMAGQLGLIDLRLKLEEIAAEESAHARVLQRLLKGM